MISDDQRAGVTSAAADVVPGRRYTVLQLRSCDDDGGNKIYQLAARQPLPDEPRKMSYGPARGLTLEDAQNTASLLRSGADAAVAVIFEEPET